MGLYSDASVASEPIDGPVDNRALVLGVPPGLLRPGDTQIDDMVEEATVEVQSAALAQPGECRGVRQRLFQPVPEVLTHTPPVAASTIETSQE